IDPNKNLTLANTRWSRFDACAYFFQPQSSTPSGFHPPSDTCIGPWANDRDCLLTILCGRLTFPHDIKRCWIGTVLIDKCFHGSYIRRCHVSVAGQLSSKQSIIAQNTLHGFHTWPSPNHPYGN